MHERQARAKKKKTAAAAARWENAFFAHPLLETSKSNVSSQMGLRLVGIVVERCSFPPIRRIASGSDEPVFKSAAISSTACQLCTCVCSYLNTRFKIVFVTFAPSKPTN